MNVRERNNFDLIRLFAASQVVLLHSLTHFSLIPASGFWARIIDGVRWFPGVPIFFVVSGFLITPSLERSATLAQYARKRVLRIYPALWCYVGVCLALLAALGVIRLSTLGHRWFWMWVGCQVTVFQAWNPEQLRHFGAGAVNGSLWTIPVEVGFYVGIALLYAVFGLRKGGKWAATAVFVAAGAVSLATWRIFQVGTFAPTHGFFGKALSMTPLPHFWIWLLGALAYKHFDRVRPFVAGWFVPWFAAYLVLGRWLSLHQELMYPMLGIVTLSAAYSMPGTSRALLRGNDISYGVYLYHMLAINALIALDLPRIGWTVIAVFGCAFAVACASWLLVERPALRLKSSARQAGRSTHATAIGAKLI
ncbi:MAG TPA: acyltransferase [Tepidisphaeraceae bacterium]|nr:acyltransferase [Tepidisphaeraceae bacterium]